MGDICKAIALACEAHAGQLDKAGQPYIYHPLRLMMRLQGEEERIVSVLHDVVEDSDVSFEDLRQFGFSDRVIDAVECLTKRVGEPYEEFITRLSSNELARKVKIEDVKDNLDVTRLGSLRDQDLARIAKYHKALQYLLKKSG